MARPLGGMLSDRFGGVRVTLINFILMALFSVLLYLSLATDGHAGSFAVFFGLFMLLFLTARLQWLNLPDDCRDFPSFDRRTR